MQPNFEAGSFKIPNLTVTLLFFALQNFIVLHIPGVPLHTKRHFLLSLQLSELCEREQVVLYALPPNTTHLLQPADVAVFGPLKARWTEVVGRWQRQPENFNRTLSKRDVPGLLKDALKSVAPETIKAGFRKCGLFPLNRAAPDYTKLLPSTLENVQAPESFDVVFEDLCGQVFVGGENETDATEDDNILADAAGDPPVTIGHSDILGDAADGEREVEGSTATAVAGLGGDRRRVAGDDAMDVIGGEVEAAGVDENKSRAAGDDDVDSTDAEGGMQGWMTWGGGLAGGN